jgi:type II secretory pathway pseudopilin PulG
MKIYPTHEEGQTLIEAVLAIGILVAVLPAIVLTATNVLNQAQYTRNKSLANSYAREGMSVVRAIKDTSWTDFTTSYPASNKYCIDSDLQLNAVAMLYNCGSNASYAIGADGTFSREVTFIDNPSDCLGGRKTTVKILWADGKCSVSAPYCNSVELVTCLLNIR